MMSEAAAISVADDPFAPTVLDEETELRALSRALQFADGFSLLFVRCNQPDQRRRLAVALRNELPYLKVQEIALAEPVPHLLDALRERLEEPPPDAVFVSGLEYSLPVAAEAATTPFVANLNAARNSFPQVIPRPLVLWVPEYVLTAITRGAPDFFSVRSGVYYFAADVHGYASANSFMTTEIWQTESLSFPEREERIRTLESLLADSPLLPPDKRALRTEMNLLSRLGHLYYLMQRWSDAETAHKRSLQAAQQLGDRSGEAAALNNLSIAYRVQGRWAEAEDSAEKSLAIRRRSGDWAGEAHALITLGNIYRSRKDWPKAEQAYQRGLDMLSEVDDPAGTSKLYMNFGALYLDQERWREAEEALRRSLFILGSHPNDQGRQRVFTKLSQLYFLQDRWSDAELMLRQALPISQHLHDRQSEMHAYANLGHVYRQQLRLAEAEAAYQKASSIAQQLGDPAGEGRMLYEIAAMWHDQFDARQALEWGRKSVAALETSGDTKILDAARKLVNAMQSSEPYWVSS